MPKKVTDAKIPSKEETQRIYNEITDIIINYCLENDFCIPCFMDFIAVNLHQNAEEIAQQ